jgi:hypothetical protein
MFFKAVVRCQASGATSILFIYLFFKRFWIFSWLLKPRKKNKEKGRKKEILPSSTSLFLFLFYSSCDLDFFLIGIFSLLLIPLPRPMSSFVRVGSFSPYLCL